MIACWGGKAQVVQRLLEGGARVDIRAEVRTLREIEIEMP